MFMQDEHLRRIEYSRVNTIKGFKDPGMVKKLLEHTVSGTPSQLIFLNCKRETMRKILQANAVGIGPIPPFTEPMTTLDADILRGVVAGYGYRTDGVRNTIVVFPAHQMDQFLFFLGSMRTVFGKVAGDPILRGIQMRSKYYQQAIWPETSISPVLIDLKVVIGYLCTDAVSFSPKRGGKIEFRSYSKTIIDMTLKLCLRKKGLTFTKTSVAKRKKQPPYYRFECYGEKNCRILFEEMSKYQDHPVISESETWRRLKNFMTRGVDTD